MHIGINLHAAGSSPISRSADLAKDRPILVVEDDPAIREVLCQLLEQEGLPVVSAPNGQAALDLMDQGRPSLVLLDMHMPVLDGWGFARQLVERGWDPPILVVTATARDARQRAQEIGARGYVAKPFHLAELLAAIACHRVP